MDNYYPFYYLKIVKAEIPVRYRKQELAQALRAGLNPRYSTGQGPSTSSPSLKFWRASMVRKNFKYYSLHCEALAK